MPTVAVVYPFYDGVRLMEENGKSDLQRDAVPG